MKKDEIIKLACGQTATIIKGDESQFNNVYIVMLEDGQKRVVDKKTLEIAEALGDTKSKHSYYHNK